jgi:flavin-dependent dehydrogenase
VTSLAATEVLVIGGGPAGAVSAIALARLGRKVVLSEAVAFPRSHIGISLSPGVARQLTFLGLGHLLQNPEHLAKVRVERRWGGGQFEPSPHAEGLIADRGSFDADLLDAARAHGVRVLQPARVGALRRAAGVWTIDVATPDGSVSLEVALIVEASGRQSRFRRRARLGAATVALCGVWRGEIRPIVQISAARGSWSWTAPTKLDRRIAIAFTDPTALRRAGGSLRQRYADLLQTTGVLDRSLELVDEPSICDATPYVVEDEVEGILRVGDADLALDPVSSSGVQAAIQSALSAGPVINTLLSGSGDHTAALEFWRRRRAARLSDHRRWAAELYADAFARHPTDFWRRRCEPAAPRLAAMSRTPLPHPDQPVRLSGEVVFVQAPCLVDGTVMRLDCVAHPNLNEPIAFLDGLQLSTMLAGLKDATPARQLLAQWALACPAERAYAMLAWAWRRQILVAP